MTTTALDIERDAIEGHFLTWALSMRIRDRILWRRWYRSERAKGWPKPTAEMLNTAALMELLALRRLAKRAAK